MNLDEAKEWVASTADFVNFEPPNADATAELMRERDEVVAILDVIPHGLAVAREVEGADAKLVAILHDAVEDGHCTQEEIGRCIDYSTSYAVGLLTRDPEEDYREYILRLAVATGPAAELAQRVKLADLRVNLDRLDADHESLRPRYEQAVDVLTRHRERTAVRGR